MTLADAEKRLRELKAAGDADAIRALLPEINRLRREAQVNQSTEADWSALTPDQRLFRAIFEKG